jgi:hypothetical protein
VPSTIVAPCTTAVTSYVIAEPPGGVKTTEAESTLASVKLGAPHPVGLVVTLYTPVASDI